MYIGLKSLWCFNLLKKLNIYVDFINSRFVFFMCRIQDFENNDIEKELDIGNFVPTDDYITINCNL